MKKYLLITIAMLGLLSAQGVVTQLDKGSINYSDQTITAVGIGCAYKRGKRGPSKKNGFANRKTGRDETTY